MRPAFTTATSNPVIRRGSCGGPNARGRAVHCPARRRRCRSAKRRGPGTAPGERQPHLPTGDARGSGRVDQRRYGREYRRNRSRAGCQVALAEDAVKVAYQQILDAFRHALFSLACAQTCAWPPSANSSAPVTKLESSDARNSAALAISSGSATRPCGSSDAI
jgi:hypothetical protein